jgi:heat-inducible transcriptional repressor
LAGPEQVTKTQTPEARHLSPRDQEILRAVIALYILNAEPVSSRLVSRKAGLGLSPATIRNVMADLEEWGYLVQPHTSAGRVPTGGAYHLFIESMMAEPRLPARLRRYIRGHLDGAPGDPEQLMTTASHLLSELSQQVGLVLTPARGDTVLKAIDFVPLSGSKVLCVVVSTAGFVDNRIVETDPPLGREQLLRISNYLNDNYAGLTLREIRDRLVALMSEERAQMDRLLAQTIELARRGLEFAAGGEVLVDGTSTVLNQPELADIQRVRRLFDTFAEKARLVKILNQCMTGAGMRVWIGEDTEVTSELDFSLVATTYGIDDQPLGTLGIFGPSRMEYQKVIPLVSYLGETLSRALSATMGGGGPLKS